jgi:flagellar hook-associated protein 3 FlgL
MRVTNDTFSRQVLGDLSNVSSRLARLQGQLSTGKEIVRPEDDPFRAGRAVALRNELGDVGQYKRAVDDGVAWLTAADGAMGNAGDILHRVRELVLQGSNGTLDQTALNALAKEVGQLKEALRQQANGTFGGRYLFAGTETTTPPYPEPATTYAGNGLPVQRLISPGQVVAINTTGPAMMGPDGTNVLDRLTAIEADLLAGNRTNLQNSDLINLDTAIDRTLSARAAVGAMTNRLETQLARLDDHEVNLRGLLSNAEDADMARTMVEFSQTQAVYQAALQSGARIMQPTLMDFLR